MVAGLRNMRRTGRKIRLLAVDGDLRGFPVGAVVKNPPAKAGGGARVQAMVLENILE